MKSVMFELLKIRLGSIMMGKAILEKNLTTFFSKDEYSKSLKGKTSSFKMLV